MIENYVDDKNVTLDGVPSSASLSLRGGWALTGRSKLSWFPGVESNLAWISRYQIGPDIFIGNYGPCMSASLASCQRRATQRGGGCVDASIGGLEPERPSRSKEPCLPTAEG